jgi:serine/threonine protein kinase
MKEFADEARIWAHLSQVQHRNVVQMRGILKEPSIGIVMEYVPGGDLHSLLKKQIGLSWFMKLRIMLEIAQGMNVLHRMVPPIVHFDLRSPNILVRPRCYLPFRYNHSLTACIMLSRLPQSRKMPLWWQR